MTEIWKNDDFCVIKEKHIPTDIRFEKDIASSDELLIEKPACVSFLTTHCSEFQKQGAFVVLDFGMELCGGIRMVTRAVDGVARFHLTFGESLTECLSNIGEKNATNDHSPRDFEAVVPAMSDLTFGQTGFRFVRIELLSSNPVLVKNIFAMNTLPYFEKEAVIKTSDPELNKIIDTAFYTLKLNFQNGYIWDGIKRDRLVWCGDLHQEIITSIYLFGDNSNIKNSLSFLRAETPDEDWMNTIPSYSAWWVINLCDYCAKTGNMTYFKENQDYARMILEKFDLCVTESGDFDYTPYPTGMPYFLDWPTLDTSDAIIGTACIVLLAAKKFLNLQENEACHNLIRKLEKHLFTTCNTKQALAFQIIAGKEISDDYLHLEEKGAYGFSTFMAYYILSADALAGGQNMLSLIKEYFGAMISRGATTFWEDFHMDWLTGSGRIDEIPSDSQKDIHGDYGAYCYEGFRHSLCHGWASGVLSFIIEYMFGLQISENGQDYTLTPRALEVSNLYAKLPFKDGWLEINVTDGVGSASFKK